MTPLNKPPTEYQQKALTWRFACWNEPLGEASLDPRFVHMTRPRQLTFHDNGTLDIDAYVQDGLANVRPQDRGKVWCWQNWGFTNPALGGDRPNESFSASQTWIGRTGQLLTAIDSLGIQPEAILFDFEHVHKRDHQDKTFIKVNNREKPQMLHDLFKLVKSNYKGKVPTCNYGCPLTEYRSEHASRGPVAYHPGDQDRIERAFRYIDYDENGGNWPWIMEIGHQWLDESGHWHTVTQDDFIRVCTYARGRIGASTIVIWGRPELTTPKAWTLMARAL